MGFLLAANGRGLPVHMTAHKPRPGGWTRGYARRLAPHALKIKDRGSSVVLRATDAKYPVIDWVQRQKQRTIDELYQLTRKTKPSCTKESIKSGMEDLELLIPGFVLNIEAMRAVEWVSLLSDPQAVAHKIVVIKTHHPNLDVGRALNKYPRILLNTPTELHKSGLQVRSLLATASDPDAILGEVPALLDPRNLISALVTINKWYHLSKDPVEVLQRDPDIIRRAKENDVPFEPVYVDENGNWMAPLLNYKEKRTDWQAYIDRTVYKQA